MASLLAANVCNILFFSSLFLISMAPVSVTGYQFRIGGRKGWIELIGNETETYNKWATRNRFHVEDSVYFEYKNDSVLVVNNADYTNCNVSNPIAKFKDGNTVFRFDRYGFFYFISGEPGHCESGQRLVIRVMVHPEVEPPSPSPTAGSGSGGGNGSGSSEWGAPMPNSTVKLLVGSYFITALGGMMVILYMFM